MTSLDFSCDVTHWKESIQVAMEEMRRIRLYGVTQGEFIRSKHAIRSEVEQLLAQSEHISGEVGWLECVCVCVCVCV